MRIENYRKKLVSAVLAAIVCLTLITVNAGFAHHSYDNKKNILILNSYHKGYKWTDNIVEGISSVLGPNAQRFNVQIEDMDTKRISADEQYINKLYEIYKYKFQDKKFDVIICSDDAAFQFLEQFHQQLFPGTPIVFCGVNYFEDSMVKDRNVFTGVVEMYDIRKTLETALTIHPNTKNVYVINDKTITGQGIRRNLLDTTSEFTNINFISLEDLKMPEILDRVQRLPQDSIVLFLVFFQDVAGDYFTYDESISLVSGKSQVPVYGVWDFYLGHGIVGGMLTNGYFQGEMAAKMALSILNGQQPSTIPVVQDSTNRYMFDEVQMKRFGIKNYQLPENSMIINQVYSNKKQLLVLNSYHSDMVWVQNIDAGIKSILGDNKNIEFHTDYMDTKRNPSPEYLQKLHEAYNYKYSNKKFDAVLVTDDIAYSFMLTYQQELFPNTPIVFCGVNNFNEEEFAQHNQWFTGIVENIDIEGTIKAALQMHPNTKTIAVINDKTPLGQSNRRLLNSIMPSFSANGINFVILEDMNMSEVQEKVTQLPEDSIILLLSFNQDKSNNIFSYEESIELIAQRAKVPIYGLWDFYIGHGIVGGLLTNGYSQGEMAAKMVSRILSGEQPRNIPVVKESPNSYMFDYNQLLKFSVDPKRMPEGSFIVNRPITFYEQYRSLVWGVGSFIVLLVTAICLLYVNIVRRKKVERELQLYATTDTMTGVLNRRTGLIFLEEQIALADRTGKSFTVCFVDVNDLKKVNDKCGHNEGDRLIEAVSQILKEALRKSDLLCRLGGDEFLIILSDNSMQQGEQLWQRIAERINTYNDTSDNCFTISLSHGFAEYMPASATSAADLIKEADFNMYKCKNSGKVSVDDDYNL
ncbi:ABC transporter substrate binding protein [Dendrosporobacter sp. 1207_IL3150]|uniref:ABC transporter substrate binding protein n=1 Tax=Dendrosporobacter sp. 1207_IL3150 TaxID=3084054 RepID=UPI002FD8EFEB